MLRQHTLLLTRCNYLLGVVYSLTQMSREDNSAASLALFLSGHCIRFESFNKHGAVGGEADPCRMLCGASQYGVQPVETTG